MKKGDWIYFTIDIKLSTTQVSNYGLSNTFIKKDTPFKIKYINKDHIQIYLHQRRKFGILEIEIDSWTIRNIPKRMQLHSNPELCEVLYGLPRDN